MNSGASRRLQLRLARESWPLRIPFRITGHTTVALEVVVAAVTRGGLTGRGEAAGVDYRGDTPDSMLAQLEGSRAAIEAGVTREQLPQSLPAGGARNALDCALWELESLEARTPVWQLAGLPRPQPLVTTCTIGADGAEAMAARALEYREASALKLKLTGEREDAARVRAVRAARPQVWLGVDANQGFDLEHVRALMPALVEARVALIEQPFAVGREPPLAELRSPIPVAADESAQVPGDLAGLVGRFDTINIKLDKCGGLSEALRMATLARQLGFDTMIGNMLGTSLAMAPAWLVGQGCRVVDLDGPLLLASDRDHAAVYSGGTIRCDEGVWGYDSTAGERPCA
jgi:L-alanine-DL-glutamate epimerase-like enolase superfamily enzyme